ncbi:MAG: hypothetical protein IJ191_06820 [Treponema sp.]|nr:hypothetical protein [Treponema sp.]
MNNSITVSILVVSFLIKALVAVAHKHYIIPQKIRSGIIIVFDAGSAVLTATLLKSQINYVAIKVTYYDVLYGVFYIIFFYQIIALISFCTIKIAKRKFELQNKTLTGSILNFVSTLTFLFIFCRLQQLYIEYDGIIMLLILLAAVCAFYMNQWAAQRLSVADALYTLITLLYASMFFVGTYNIVVAVGLCAALYFLPLLPRRRKNGGLV